MNFILYTTSLYYQIKRTMFVKVLKVLKKAEVCV